MKYIYNFDENGIFTNTEPAYLNQAETLNQGKEVYFCPEGSTLAVPPQTKEHETLRFNGENWQIIKDYRNCHVADENMKLSSVDYLGEIKTGYVLLTEDEYQKILIDPIYYIVQNGKLVKNPNYEAECAKKERLACIDALKKELDELDKKRIRAMCEPSEYAKGLSWLDFYNNQAQELRAELQTLEGITTNDSISKK